MPGNQLTREAEAAFLAHLTSPDPLVNIVLRQRGQRMLRLRRRVQRALDDAGYPEGLLHPDTRYAKPGFIIISHTPSLNAPWGLGIQHYDYDGANSSREWMEKYTAALSGAGIDWEPYRAGVLSHVGEWWWLYVRLDANEEGLEW
jgi:hypothetical protein